MALQDSQTFPEVSLVPTIVRQDNLQDSGFCTIRLRKGFKEMIKQASPESKF